MLRSASSIILLIGAAQALPWDGASPTNNAELFPVRDHDFPRPTNAAELRKRQEPGDVLCAWEDGSPDSSMALYCRSQKECATNSLGVFGCCASSTIDNCALYTTCIDSTSVNDYLSSYGTDEYAIFCTLQQNPICVTEYIELAVTVTGWLCGPTTSANPQTYYPSDYNLTAASTESPVIYKNAGFDGYTPPTLISTSTSSPSTTAPTTTSAPPTTSMLPPSSSAIPPPTTSSSAPTPAPSSGSSTPIGAIVGGVIGGIAVIGIIALVAFLLIRHSRRQQNNNAAAANANAGVQPAYPSGGVGGVAPMQQMHHQGSPPIVQNAQYANQPNYQYGDPAIQQAQYAPQHQPGYGPDSAGVAPAYPAPGGYPEKSPVQSSTSPQISNYSPALGVGQDQRASNVPLYSPTASEMGPGSGTAPVVNRGPVHELGD